MKLRQCILAISAFAMTALLPTFPARASTAADQVLLHADRALPAPTEERSIDESAACYELLQDDLQPEFQRAIKEAAKYYRIHEFEKVIDGQTKYLVVMTPGQPTGATTAEELRSLQNLARHFDKVGVTGQGTTVGSILGIKIVSLFERKCGPKSLARKSLRKSLGARLYARTYGSYSRMDDSNVLSMYDQVSCQKGSQDPIETIRLDEGYRPGIAEHADSIGTTLTWGIGYLIALASGHLPHVAFLGAEGLLTAVSTYRSIMRFGLTSPTLRINRWAQGFFPLGVGWIRGNSAAIVNRIETSLAQDATLLAIVPQNHIDAVNSLLQNDGYEQRN